MPHWTALITIFALLTYAAMGIAVGRARAKYGVKPPATTGNADFERVFRVQMNTLEWLPVFLPALWMFAFYVGDKGAAALGLVWIAGRVLFMQGYAQAAEKRGMGFIVQAVACLVLIIGSLIAIVLRLVN